MIFLVPLLIIIAVIFGIDYFYFSNKNPKVKKQEKIIKQDKNSSQEYLKKILNNAQENSQIPKQTAPKNTEN